MLSFFHTFLQKDGLTPTQNNIYRNFNILVFIALLDITVVMFSLRNLNPQWPFRICVAEFLCLLMLLVLHLRGNFIVARYGTFLVTLIVQATACIIHGRTAGFDYLFYALAVLPTLFFERPGFYVSLFMISIITMLGMQYTYTVSEPVIVIPVAFIYYWNIFFTGALVLLVMYIFKSGYVRTQEKLLEQHNTLAHQKEEIEVINNNLEQIVVDRTERIKDQESRINNIAFINAHKVRSPLARIMGLLTLIELEKNNEGTIQECLPLLRSNAEELNEMLKEVNATLNGMNGGDTDV